jgi:deoxyribodipyrimidine photo-lyase
MKKIAVHWFRRDLRLEDNASLFYALKSGYEVLPIFIFDTTILQRLEDKDDKRVQFIVHALENLQKELRELGSSLCVKYGEPLDVWKELANEFDIAEVFCNHDYEKYGIERDKKVGQFLNENATAFYTFKDQVIFEKNEVLSGAGTPYTVFTPYSKKWKETLTDFYTKAYPTENYFSNFYKTEPFAFPSLTEIGFQASDDFQFPEKIINQKIIAAYTEQRDFPAIEQGTTRLSVHLRFGTVSIRALVKVALATNEKWLNELIWRDFYMNILWHFPHINEGLSFRKEYDRIEWRNNEAEFEKWCKGKTGFPIVDAGMRELNATGFMHNRVRMITASFLVKDLLIDWRWGETYFAKKLLDFDFAANNGGWQWAAGSGCDAAPYFRIFNPDAQTQKFDGDRKYIRRWIPELTTYLYPQPIVDHAKARERTLAAYKKALNKE